MARQWSCTAYGWKSRQSPKEWAGHLAILSGHPPRLFRFLLLQRQLQDLCSTRLEAFAVERAIAADPDISLHGRLAASQQPTAPAAAGRWIPYRYPATLSSENSSIKEQISLALLQMLRHFCYSSRAPLQAADKHVECVSCLGAAQWNVITAVVSTLLSTLLSSLRSRLAFFSESNTAPRALPFFSSQRPARKKQQGTGSQRPEMSELMPAVTPHTSLSSYRVFTSYLHPPRPASLCERTDLIRGER